MTTQTRDTVMTFRPDADLRAAMARLQARDGIPPSEQIRRALRRWLTAKGTLPRRTATSSTGRKQR